MASTYERVSWNIQEDRSLSPLWVLGMFRSGTSLTSQILLELGLDFGPDKHLLQPIGSLKHLNPNGFFENYVFAEYSRYFFQKLDSKGDEVPHEERLCEIDFNKVDISELFEWSLFKFNDDRISLSNKFSSIRLVAEHGLNHYLKSQFKNKACVKIPMLSHFYPQINRVWPNSFFLVVFRHPISLLKSSRALTKGNTYDLYNDYYRFLIKITELTTNYIFFSYDHLIKNPKESVNVLIDQLKLDSSNAEKAISLIDVKLVRNVPIGSIENEECQVIYNSLLKLAVNVK